MSDWRVTGKWADEDKEFWDQNTGAPALSFFSNAVQVWALLQNSNVTIEEAAAAFNVPPARIYEAVEYHYWMFLLGDGNDPTNDLIIHEGE